MVWRQYSDSNEDDFGSNITCTSFVVRNSTIQLNRGWEGIPESVLLNIIICAILLLLLVLVRHLAKLSESSINGFIQYIYGDSRHESVKHAPMPSNTRHNHDLYHSHLLLPPKNNHQNNEVREDSGDEINTNNTDVIFSNRGSQQNLVNIGNENEVNQQNHEKTVFESVIGRLSKWCERYCHYLYDALIIKESDILQRKGIDAYQYIIFQRYIICFLALVSVICIVIILPVNVVGNKEGENKAFRKTTLSNIDGTSNLLWIHTVLAALLIPFGIFLMNQFSKVIRAEDENIARRTLIIRRLPKLKNIKELLIEYFQKNFSDCHIEGIQLVFDVRKLESYEIEFSNAVSAKKHCAQYFREKERKIEIRPYCLGQFGDICCCYCCSKVDGLEYYSERELEYETKIKREVNHTFLMPMGSAFITFQSEKTTLEVYKYLRQRQQTCICISCPIDWIINKIQRKETDMLATSRWQISYAPYPDDINWKFLAVDFKLIWLRKILVYLLLFVIFFFLSTPAILLKVLEFLEIQKSLQDGLGKIDSTLTEFLSPLLLMLMTIILPAVVTFACELLPYKTLSALNHGIMWKVYVFLLMMVIILPSAGFLSTNALLEDIFNPNANVTSNHFRWQCLFPVDSGAFFVNYALQAALLGNVVELMRLPELFLYIIYRLIGRSSSEYEKAQKEVTFEFPFGVSYPRFLLIIAMTLTFCISCPLIAPCGLFYMICKHLVDRYNIYYVYTPTKINGRIHSTAVIYVHIALIMMQFQVFTFLLSKTGYSQQNSKVMWFSLFVLIIALLIFAAHCFFHWFSNLNHITYSVTSKLNKRSKKQNFCACAYIPPVVYNLLNHRVISDNDFIVQTTNN